METQTPNVANVNEASQSDGEKAYTNSLNGV
jgi:hypothetical protein